MSKVKVSFLVVGLLAISAAVLAIVGTGQLNSPATANADVAVASTDAGDANSESSCSKNAATSSCSKTATATAGSCPSSAALAGADGDKSKGCGSSCSTACPSASSCGVKQAKTASIEPISKREGERVVLVGHYVCGSCDLGVSEKCAAAFQTKDGKNYLLVKNNMTVDLKEKARKKDVEIVTTVKKYEGEKYLEVETINPVS